jgi:hypothetical protein
VEKYGTATQATHGNIKQGMRFACWTTKATDTHSEYVILIVFPRKQWLSESGSMLRYSYTYTYCQNSNNTNLLYHSFFKRWKKSMTFTILNEDIMYMVSINSTTSIARRFALTKV